jgi:hypothetical protein
VWVTSVAAGLVVSPALFRTERAEAHPLHTSLAELSYDVKTGAVLLSLRVFVDDFSRASASYRQSHALPPATRAPTESPLVSYALASFSLTDSRGRRATLVSCGGKRVGDLMWLCFRGVLPPGAGLHVLSQVLFDTYRDQINIVQATSGGRKSNLLFTPGESAKSVL